MIDSREITATKAEQLCGRKVDKRRKYALINKEVCTIGRWTEACSGCNQELNDRGDGCHECGYTGVRRKINWVPMHDNKMTDVKPKDITEKLT